MASSHLDPPRPWGSPERFADLVHSLHDPLIALARRILRSDDLARDAVQEAMLSLWLEPEAPPNPRAWLVRAVVHRCLHLMRSRSRRRRHEGRACRQHPESSDRDDPARRLEAVDFVKKVQRAFAHVGPEYREVLVLRAVEEMDYESIAITLQIPIGTVRSRLNRSRKVIREILRDVLPAKNHVPKVGDEESGANGQESAGDLRARETGWVSHRRDLAGPHTVPPLDP